MMRGYVIAASVAILTAGCGTSGQHERAVSANTAAPRMQTTQTVTVSKDTVKQMQQALQAKGFYNGPVDGVMGPQTRTAVAAYQQSQGRSRTAVLDGKTLQELTGATVASNAPNAGSENNASGSTTGPKMSADQVRDQLQSQGYSDIQDVRPWGNDAYTAKAAKNGQTQTVEVDGRTGQVMRSQ
jgi:peptidoglycan hydrolase-like protein with peptidoglycan-binding domain